MFSSVCRVPVVPICLATLLLAAATAHAQLPPPPAAIARLNDADPQVRGQAARELGALGPAAAPAVPPLTERLADESPLVRAYAAHALGQIGPAAAPSFPKIAALITDADPQVRREAVKALRSLKVEAPLLIPVMVKVLESSSSAEVVPAMQAIAEIGKDAVAPLTAALKHDEARYWACQILGQIGADAAPAAPAVAEVLADPRVEVRREAVLCLGHLGAGAKSAVPGVLGLTGDADAGTRAAAVWAAVMIGASADELRPKLAPLATDADPMVQIVAAWAAAKLDPADAAARTAAVAKAVAALGSDRPPVRGIAARALVDLRVTSDGEPEATEAIIHALADGDEAVAPVVTHALLEAGEAAVPRLIKALERPEVRGYACMVLAELGPKAKSAKDALRQLAEEQNVYVRAAALTALAAVAGDDPQVVALTAAGLDNSHVEVRFAAAVALVKLGAAAKPAEAALRAHAEDPDPAVRDAVARALKAIAP